MIDRSIDIEGWSKWAEDHRAIGSKLTMASRVNMEAYFLTIHATSEVMFRRILLVGLRLNMVAYTEANNWLYHNDDTPEREKFPSLFDRLYISKHVTWSQVIGSDSDLPQLWELWLSFSKIIRNHISHGIRKYSDDWFLCGIAVDQELLLRLDRALAAKIGGSVCTDLRKINPRLPTGKKGADLKSITNRKSRNPRPTVSLVAAQNFIDGLVPGVG